MNKMNKTYDKPTLLNLNKVGMDSLKTDIVAKIILRPSKEMKSWVGVNQKRFSKDIIKASEESNISVWELSETVLSMIEAGLVSANGDFESQTYYPTQKLALGYMDWFLI